MSVTNPDKVVTKQDLADFYGGIFPYLGGMPEVLANKFSRADLYSTTEKIVGCWTDGRPIYQKTISCGALPNNSVTTIATGVSSINRVINIEGYSRRNTDGLILPLPYVDKTISGSNVASVDLVYVASSNVIRITTGTDRSAFTETYVTIQYTKTTDSANSFKYADENDYSTSEKIVGTWIDGKPIYQKTFKGTLTATNKVGTETTTFVSMGAKVDTFVNIEGGVLFSGMYFPISACRGDISATLRFIGHTNTSADTSYKNQLALINAWFTSSSTYYVTIQYTKTT